MNNLKQLFHPCKDCLVLATDKNPFSKENKKIGMVIKVDENIVAYKDFDDGLVHYLIWKFKKSVINTYYKFAV